MLFGPPPGANAPSINRQNIGTMSIPGFQGAGAQGYGQYSSNYATPSSYAVPSSVNAPNPYYNKPMAHPMVKALMGGMR